MLFEDKIFKDFISYTYRILGAGPISTPGTNNLGRGHLGAQNILGLGLVASEKDFYMFPI